MSRLQFARDAPNGRKGLRLGGVDHTIRVSRLLSFTGRTDCGDSRMQRSSGKLGRGRCDIEGIAGISRSCASFRGSGEAALCVSVAFVRKVMASAIELGLDGFLSLEAAVNPTMPTVRNPAIAVDNPLSKVPTLVLADGERLFDSIVICEYLDDVAGGNKLFPPSGVSRWRALRTNALADGILDAGVAVRLERVRPQDKRWGEWIDGQMLKINGSLDLLENSFDTWSKGFGIGHIAVSCALQWLEFREVVEDPAKGRERLYAWQDEFLERPSMARTRPA